MKLAAMHAALLVAALVWAYQTWTRDSRAVASPGSVVLWSASTEGLRSLHYQVEDILLDIDRRLDERGPYFWGRVVYGTPFPPSAAADSAASPADDVPEPTAAEFVLGETGLEVLERAATLRATRDLGVVDAEREREYGLDHPGGRLVVDLGRATRELVIGGTVWGTGARYARDPQNGRVYVLDGEFIVNLESGDRALAERRLHEFGYDRVGSVVVRRGDSERRMVRGDHTPFSPVTWSNEATPAEPDQAFANFMDRLAQASPTGYESEVTAEGLTPVASLEYFSENGRSIGFLHLLRSASGEGGPRFYVITELTRGPARIYETTGEQLELDVAALF